MIKNFKKRNNLTFSMNLNKFSHLSRAELNSIYLSKINISDLLKIANKTIIKPKITNNYKKLIGDKISRKQRYIHSWVNINWAAYGYISPVQTQGGIHFTHNI